MGRLPCRDGAGVEKGPWTPEEDKLLVDYIGAHGHGSWHRLPRLAGLNRTGKSCRLRWTNHLRPDIKRVPFTNDEEKLLFSLRSTLGNKWSKIATRMPGRTGNEIKNYWFTHLRKKLPDMGIDPDPQRPLIDGFRDIYRRALVEASSLPTSVGPGSSSNILQDPPDPKSCAVPDEFFDFSTVASFDFGAGDTQTDGLRNFYPPTSVGPGSSSSIPADPARSLDFSTSFDFGSASPSSSIQADPAQFLDCSNYFDFDSGDTHNDLLSNVNPHTFLEELANSFFPPYSGAGSSSFSIKANPAQPPSSSFYTASGIVLEESAFLSSSHNSPLFDDSVSASSGAMRPLVGKLDKLLEGSVSISKRVKDGVRLLKDDVEEISSYLDELSGLEDPPPMAKCWMNEVRDLSYDIEDYIDSTLFRRPNCLNKKKKKMMMKKFTNHVKIPKIRLKCCNCKQTKSKHVKTRWVCRNIRHIVINNRRSKRPRNIGAPEMISDFRKYLQEAIERHDRYKLHCCSTLRRRFLSTGRMLPTPYEEADQIVMDDRTKTFINSLVSNDAADQQQLKVVSVLGSGCLGKTTLAKQLYNRIGMQFDCRAFIRVPKNPDMKRLFRDLFSQLHHKKQPLPTSSNELVISDNISNYLEDKRYLIVIDDLLDASVWDIIKYAFPKGNRGSRIITTTQIEDVALTCCCDNSEHVFEMKPLNDDHSRKLFFDRLFGKESGCPEEFKQVSDEIVDMCGGLPLAIINIASHLANQQNAVSMDLLIHIRDSLRSDLQSNSTSERTRQVLNLSYNNLPDCLKTCLLYLGMYPEGSIISKDDMVKKWMAERFAAREQKEQDQDMMEKAGNYFSELIDRRFIQPIYTDYNNKVLSCMVHDVVRDLIAHKSAEENFIVVVDYNRKNIALSHKVRRLSLLFGDARYAKTPANIRMSQVRSLVFFGLFECMPCIKEFKVLRVLNLQLSSHCGDHDPIDLTGISELLQLRYLKIASDVCIKLPNSMRRLQCLETLDIMGVTRLAFFPWDIIHLPHLFHLTLPADTKLLNWIGSMSDSVISLWSLGKLKYLQDLHLIDPSTHLSYYLERSMKALCSLLEGHGNLKTIVVARGSSAKNIIYGDSNVIIPWDHMAPPPLLQRFEFSPDSSIIFFRIPPWVQNLSNLRILKIAVMALQMSCLDILGSLPALTALSLHLRRAPTYEISFDNNGFSALKYFKLRFMSGLAWLNFEADAMPGLWKLKLVFNDIPEMDHQGGTPTISIEHMPGLKAISAKFGGAASDVEYALRNIISNHPSNPRVNMQFVGYSSNVDGSTKEKQSSDDIMEEPDEYVRQQIRERSSDKRISKSPESTSRLHVPEK